MNPASNNSANRKRIALVIGPDLLRCAASLGMVRVLQQENIPLDVVIGSGTGALFAAAIALGYNADQMIPIVTQISQFYNRNTGSWRPSLGDIISGFNEQTGLVNDSEYVKILQNGFGSKTFADTKIPLTLIATNLINGESVTLSEGSIASALRCSCAFLGLLSAVTWKGQLLTDGALAEPLPLATPMEMNSDIILLMGYRIPLKTTARSVPDYVHQLAAVTANNLMNAQNGLTQLAASGEIVSIVPKFSVAIDSDDTQLLPFIIEKGAEATTSMMAYIKSLL